MSQESKIRPLHKLWARFVQLITPVCTESLLSGSNGAPCWNPHFRSSVPMGAEQTGGSCGYSAHTVFKTLAASSLESEDPLR